MALTMWPVWARDCGFRNERPKTLDAGLLILDAKASGF